MIGILSARARLTLHFRNQYLQFTSFKVHSGKRSRIILSKQADHISLWCWNGFSPNVNFFGLEKKIKINAAIVRFNLPVDDSKSFSFYKRKAVGS